MIRLLSAAKVYGMWQHLYVSNLARRPNIAFALTGILLSGASREFAVGFSLARSVDIVTVEKIDRQLASYGAEMRAGPSHERMKQLIALIDDGLEQRRILTHG